MLPQSQSFKYLGLVFHESGQCDKMFQRLYQNGLGSKARLVANFKQLGCASSLPMQCRLFDTLVTPAASYGCEIWGGHFLGRLSVPAKSLLGLQASFLRRVCSLPKTVSLPPLFEELAQEPWDMQWWRKVVRFAFSLGRLSDGSLHKEILKDNVIDARGRATHHNWAGQLMLRAQHLGLPPPFDGSGAFVMCPAQHRQRAQQHARQVLEGSHISPRTCPSRGAKLCTYYRWFSRPKDVAEPYLELPLTGGSLRQLLRFRLSAHSLPVEQGRRDKIPRAMRVCPHCPGHHVGDERHLVFECPVFGHIRRQYSRIYTDAHSTMRLFMWHEDQKGVFSCLLRLLSEHDALLG